MKINCKSRGKDGRCDAGLAGTFLGRNRKCLIETERANSCAGQQMHPRPPAPPPIPMRSPIRVIGVAAEVISSDEAARKICMVAPSVQCCGERCMAWRPEFVSEYPDLLPEHRFTGPIAITRTPTGKGLCGMVPG